jgi:hypothetical protein
VDLPVNGKLPDDVPIISAADVQRAISVVTQ